MAAKASLSSFYYVQYFTLLCSSIGCTQQPNSYNILFSIFKKQKQQQHYGLYSVSMVNSNIQTIHDDKPNNGLDLPSM